MMRLYYNALVKPGRWIILIGGMAVITVVAVYFYRRKPPEQTVLSATTAETIGKCRARQVDTGNSQAWLPDPNCTPGVINPTVTQENIGVTICKSGYTKTVRPDWSYTNKLKIQQIKDYGYTDTNLGSYEEDHLISLELGGSPTDPKNLWPEPYPSFNEKDKTENYLNDQVCSGKTTLQEAQREISTNWYKTYKNLTP